MMEFQPGHLSIIIGVAAAVTGSLAGMMAGSRQAGRDEERRFVKNTSLLLALGLVFLGGVMLFMLFASDAPVWALMILPVVSTSVVVPLILHAGRKHRMERPASEDARYE